MASISPSGTSTILSELLHLDAPLFTAEITDYGERVQEVPWAKESFLFHPYCVFQRKNNALYYFYDQKGVDWKIERAGACDEKMLCEKVSTYYQQIEPFIKDERALTREEFIALRTLLMEFWPWFDGLWWMIEYCDKHSLDVTNLIAVRKQTEFFTPSLAATTRNTFRSLASSAATHVDVLLADEVLDGNIPSEEVLQARMHTYAYTEGKLFNSIEDVVRLYNVEVQEEKHNASGELKGQVAYPGKVTGTVKIVKSREDMQKFQKGDIIVSSTTTPDFLPIMKISGAIISEHGGVICHASITSRELKIPCIVGVKGATKVLKDGDLIEVDADSGVIKILQKHGI